MKIRSFKIISILVAVILSMAMPSPVQSRRTSSKQRTTQSRKYSKSRKSSRSGKSSYRSRNSSRTRQQTSGSATSAAKPESAASGTAAATPAPAAAPKVKTDSKRKIVVEKPDLDEIRRITLDPQSKFYFPKLKKKYEVNDTTMTPEEFRNFYLGYMFQEDFDPYRVSPYSNKTDDLRSKPSHTKEEIDTITKYAQLALQDNPFDLRQMSFLVHVLKEKRKDMRAKIWEYRLEHLLGAIKSTGTGDSVENAWFVMYPEHEYDMVQLLGYEAVDAQFIEPGYDYLAVQPDDTDTRKRDKSAKGFYFNVIVPQQQYELKHPEEMTGTGDDAVRTEPAAVKEEPKEIDPDDLPAE